MAAFFSREEPDGSCALFLGEERGVFLFLLVVVVGGGLEKDGINGIDGNYVVNGSDEKVAFLI